MKVTVYVEGGGDGRKLQAKCREGFSTFFRKAGLGKRMPAVIACGGRHQAYKDFCNAVSRQPGDFNVLLVDSEGPVAAVEPWEHLKERDKWNCPTGAGKDSAHLMVEMMESWFLADRECLIRYFGDGFRESALPAPQRAIEDIPKKDLEEALQEFARGSRKGKYAKGRDSFALLSRLDAAKVLVASPHARKLVEALKSVLAGAAL